MECNLLLASSNELAMNSNLEKHFENFKKSEIFCDKHQQMFEELAKFHHEIIFVEVVAKKNI